MPSSPYVICLGDAERAELESLSRRATAPHRAVLRARIVLLAGDGAGNAEIARRLRTCEDTARKWRRRYCRKGAEGLADLPRAGRPRVFPAAVVAQVKALACELPAAGEAPLSRWTCPELARKSAAGGIDPAPSPSTVRRWLAADAIKPWRHRSWIFPRDPRFAEKAGRVLDLYQREWEGQPLGDDEYVISADEKPGIQARMRIHLPLPPEHGRAARVEAEYRRHGTIAYLAAYDVHRARLTGRCDETPGSSRSPRSWTRSCRPSPTHRRGGSSESSTTARPTATGPQPPGCPTPTPTRRWSTCPSTRPGSTRSRSTSPSWSARPWSPTTSRTSTRPATQVLAFEKHYNAAARPFDWRFTRTDLNQLLARVQDHDWHTPKPEAHDPRRTNGRDH